MTGASFMRLTTACQSCQAIAAEHRRTAGMQCDSYTLLSYLQRSSLTACLIDAACMLQMTLPWCSCVVTERALSPSRAKKNAHAEGTDSHRRLTQNAKAHTKGKGSHRRLTQKPKAPTESKGLHRKQRLAQKAKAHTGGSHRRHRLPQKAKAYTESKGLHRRQKRLQEAKARTEGKGPHRTA